MRNVEAYSRLAGVYDEIVIDPCHDQWASFLHELWSGDPEGVCSVLDLCCGTGLLAGALGPEDAEEVGDDLPANTAALLVAFENLWAGKVVDALRAADAVLIDSIRIPVDVVEAFEAS